MIPLILAAAGATGLFFIKKGDDSKKIFSDAEKIDDDTKKLLEKIKPDFEKIQSEVKESIKNLIEIRSHILNVNIKYFLENFSLIKKIKYDEVNFSKNDLIELQLELKCSNDNLNIIEILENLDKISYDLQEVDTKIDLPKWIEFVTDPNKSVVSSFFSANKKSAKIHRLLHKERTASDVYPLLITCAIMGTIKFTGYAAKGYLLNDKSQKALENANENFKNVKSFEEQIKKFSLFLNDIYDLSEKSSKSLLHFDKNFSDEIKNLNNVICKYGRHWNKFSDEDKQVIKKNADIAKNIKNILVDLKIKFEEIYLKFFNKDIEKNLEV